jgi:hypothetical protein
LKILVLCREYPLPLTSGEKIRSFHILKKLAQEHEVTLVSLVLDESELQYTGELEKLCRHVYPFLFNLSKKRSAFKSLFSNLPWDVVAWRSEASQEKVDELFTTEDFDLIWVNFLAMSSYVRKYSSCESRFILDQHNADELWWRNYAAKSKNVPLKIGALLNSCKVRTYQKNISGYFKTIISVSKSDAEFMTTRLDRDAVVWCIPNGVDTSFFTPVTSTDQSNVVYGCRHEHRRRHEIFSGISPHKTQNS